MSTPLDFCLSSQLSIVLAELHYGAENSRRIADNLMEIEQFVTRLQIVLDFGRIRAVLRATPTGPFDTLIAARVRAAALLRRRSGGG